MSARVVICCGSGGVGKTTTSAALGLSAAVQGLKVVVLTIDPAKRLADSLNVEAIGGEPVRVPIENARGHCDAVMLDVEQTFEGLIHTFAESPEAAEQILNNRYFQFASSRLGGVHEYMAAEKVRELANCGAYDVVVVDTPPSRNALDFLRAPERIAGLMDGGVMRWIAMPATRSGWRALELGSEAVAKVLRKLVGTGTIGEIAHFFELFRDLWDGFHARSLEVQGILSSPQTRFYLVTSPAPTARAEALFFLEQLKHYSMPFGGFIVNRTELGPSHVASVDELHAHTDLDLDETVTDQLLGVPRCQAKLADLHERSIQSLLSAGPRDADHWVIPDLGRPAEKLADLLDLAEHLPTLE